MIDNPASSRVPTFESIGVVLKLLGAAPKALALLRKATGRPTAEERKRIVAYRRRLEERRVFSAPFSSEVVEYCIGSILQVKDFTDAELAQLSHPALRAILGSILDHLRVFLDEWQGYQTPRDRWHHRGFDDQQDGRDLSSFFEDLGSLRSKVEILVSCLDEVVPTSKPK